MGFHPANFGLCRPFRSRVKSSIMTDRWTDRHHPSFHNAPSIQRSGHNNTSYVGYKSAKTEGSKFFCAQLLKITSVFNSDNVSSFAMIASLWARKSWTVFKDFVV